MQTAFVVRAEHRPFGLAPAPTLIVSDLGPLAERLVRMP
jgi:hypothetical protein